MTTVYGLAKTWRYLMIIPSVLLFLLFWSLFVFGGGSLDMPVGAWILLLVVSAISGGMIYGTIKSRIITSPKGIEYISFGIQVRATWDQVEKIEFTPDGIVNLHLKESISTNKITNVIRAYKKTIQLSPYISDLATSNLLKDIAKHVPSINLPPFVAQQKYSTKTYQEAGVIGLYYLGWFTTWFLFAIGLQKGVEEYLAALGIFETDSILTFIGLSLVLGLFVNTISLIRQYKVEIIKLDENSIAHKARTYYISPLVIMLISFLIGSGILVLLPSLLKSQLIILVMFLIGRVSLPVSSRIERLLFQDNFQ